MYKKFAQFSPAAYQSCDGVAKDIIRRHLNSSGMYALAGETQDADVRALKRIYYEGEIKQGWIGDWPENFATVDIPYRKKRILQKHKGFEIFFWVISGDLKHAWEVPGEALKAEYVSRKDTTRSMGEAFYQVPLIECRLIDLEKSKK